MDSMAIIRILKLIIMILTNKILKAFLIIQLSQLNYFNILILNQILKEKTIESNKF
jgi:hypothetical protein